MNEQTIFTAALERDPGELPAFLNNACGTDKELRERVDKLLGLHAHAGNFLEQPAAGPSPTLDLPIIESPGTQIGPYKLLQQIGEGGMGVVYMAEQLEPVKRRVALKIIKPGMDTRQVIARFDAEKHALAMMDHVSIARVLDAGTTELSRPYFVMELVHGVPITKYCDDNRLSPRQRLELFVPVCQAIQHAHQKGIIHRDIKPSNVMVTLYDGKPVPKVIDFGVAKATEQKLTERTLFTQYGTMVGTLEYMSPEQAEMSALGVDTRSDIYSLGVLLYELLTGSTPLSSKRMKDAAYAEILRLIKEEEPPKPSTRLSESGEALASISAQRHTEPAKLSKLMRGELDWIVMKTLEKDRNRRYETANGFAADVQRYLDDEAVQACPPSAIYRFRKFARRNRTGLLTGSVIVAALLLATSAIGWTVRDRSALQAEMERERAAARQQSEQERLVRQAKLDERISQALEETQVGYERDNLPEALTAFKRAEALLASDNGVSIELRQRVDQWRAELTILKRLEELGFHFARDDSKETDAAYSKVFLDIGINVDEMPVVEAGKRIRSHITWKRLTESLDRWTGIRHEMQFLANINSMDKAEAGRRKQRLLQVARAADPDDLRSQARLAVEKWDIKAAMRLSESPEVNQLPASTLRQLAMLIYFGNEGSHRQSAFQLLENAQFHRPGDFQLNMACANYYSRLVPPQWAEAAHYYSLAIALRPDDARVQECLAQVYAKEGKVNQAIVAYHRSIELDPNHAQFWNNRGVSYDELGQRDKALADYSKAIQLDPEYAAAWNNRGVSYGKLGEIDKALANYSQAIELDPKHESAWYNRGTTFSQLGQLDKAVADLTQAIELNPKRTAAWQNRGTAYDNLGQSDKAIADYTKAIELEPKFVAGWADRGRVYGKLGQLDKAVTDLTQVIDLDSKLAMAWRHRGVGYAKLGQSEKAVADFSKAIELDPQGKNAWTDRAAAYGALNQLDKALEDCSKAIELDPKEAMAWTNRAAVYTRLCQLDKALEDCSKAVELDPKAARVWANRGAIYGMLNQLDKALEDCSKAIELDPKTVMAWTNRAAVYVRLGRYQQALDDYAQMVERFPKTATPFAELAWLLATCPDMKFRDPGQAVELAKTAIEMAPKQGSYWNTLGVANYGAGDWPAAIDALEKAEAMQGNQCFSCRAFFLAMAHWRLENKDEARKWFDKGVEWMEKNKSQDEELRRFHAEAKDLLAAKPQAEK